MNFDFVTQAAKRMIKHGDIDLVKDDITVHLIYEPYKHDARIAFIADETVKSLSDINHHLPTEGILLKGKTYKDGDVIVTWDNSANKIFNIKKDLEEIVL